MRRLNQSFDTYLLRGSGLVSQAMYLTGTDVSDHFACGEAHDAGKSNSLFDSLHQENFITSLPAPPPPPPHPPKQKKMNFKLY